MGARYHTSSTAILFSVALLATQPAWAQQAGGSPIATGPIPPATTPQPLVAGGAASGSGGYSATSLFSAFPTNGAVTPPSVSYPDYTPAVDAARPLGIRLGASAQEVWTDNVFSVAPDRVLPNSPYSKKSDFITVLTPSVSLDIDSRRLKGGFNYNLSYDRYASNTRMDGFQQNGVGIFDSEVIDKLFFIDARGSVSEQNTSAVGGVAAGSRTSATNLTRVYTASIGPRLQQAFGDWAVGQVAYHRDVTHNQNASQIGSTALYPAAVTGSAPNDSTTDGARVELRSGNYFSRFLWDYTGDTTRNNYKTNDYRSTSHTFGTEYRITDYFGLLASGGYDHQYSTAANMSKYGGGFYTGGFHWNPSPNTDLRFGGGRRYNHASWSALAEHHFSPMTVLRVSEDSGITTDALAFSQALDAVQRGPNGGFIDPFSGLRANPASSPFGLSNSVYWQRQTNIMVRHDELRDSFALTASISERQLLANVGGGPISLAPIGTNSTVTSASVSWSHQLDPVTSAQLSLSPSVTRSTDNAHTGSKRFQGALLLNRTLTQTLSASLGYTYGATLSQYSGGIRENLITLGLSKTF